ncbi:MAG: hypothetical protein KDA68_17375 [Planctomycetaceae bacterium]|nr:hypothetical protein [Planctomycetaceae bacterium]
MMNLDWLCRDVLGMGVRRRSGPGWGGSSEVACERLESRELLSAHVGSAHKHVKVKPQKDVPNYAGQWLTSEGPMDITQDGKNITAVISPPSIDPVTATAKVKGNGSIKGKVTFFIDDQKTIVKYSAHLLANTQEKMEGTYKLTFVGLTKYTSDFTADRLHIME